MKPSTRSSIVLAMLFLTSACAALPASAPASDESDRITTLPEITASTSTATVALPLPTATAPPDPPATGTSAATAPVITQTAAPTLEVFSLPPLPDVPSLTGYNSPGLRRLERPAAVTREGITVSVDQVAVYADHIELLYTIRDVPGEVLFDPMTDDDALSCGGTESYGNLALPDGRVIVAADYLLDGKVFGTITPPAWGYLIHIYPETAPAEVDELTFSLGCIGIARTDLAPLDWAIPFRITPAGGS